MRRVSAGVTTCITCLMMDHTVPANNMQNITRHSRKCHSNSQNCFCSTTDILLVFPYFSIVVHNMQIHYAPQPSLEIVIQILTIQTVPCIYTKFVWTLTPRNQAILFRTGAFACKVCDSEVRFRKNSLTPMPLTRFQMK